MALELPSTGRLIALEGMRGPDLAATAKRLLRYFCRRKVAGRVSRWNASNIFCELRPGDPGVPGPSPRTLVLLYAADLAFRLRREIRPALEEGQCVIAAPYVESAIAFGKAAGVSRRWLVGLFRFAPKPQACYRVQERKEPSAPNGQEKRGLPGDGFLEFCCATLSANSPSWNRVVIRRRFLAYLEALERRRRCETVNRQFLGRSGSSR